MKLLTVVLTVKGKKKKKKEQIQENSSSLHKFIFNDCLVIKSEVTMSFGINWEGRGLNSFYISQ